MNLITSIAKPWIFGQLVHLYKDLFLLSVAQRMEYLWMHNIVALMNLFFRCLPQGHLKFVSRPIHIVLIEKVYGIIRMQLQLFALFWNFGFQQFRFSFCVNTWFTMILPNNQLIRTSDRKQLNRSINFEFKHYLAHNNELPDLEFRDCLNRTHDVINLSNTQSICTGIERHSTAYVHLDHSVRYR